MTDSLEAAMDKRCQDLLDLATKPTELTKAIEAVTKYLQVKHKLAEADGWGEALREVGNGQR